MRIFKRILFIIFIIALVFSLAMNVILGMSSTSLKLMFSDNMNTRVQIYYTATQEFENSKYFTISNSYTDGKNKKVTEKFSCDFSKEDTDPEYGCKLVSNQYDEENKLIKTSYFPGDGYKYTIQGETKTKTAFSNADLSNYFSSIYSGSYTNMYYLVQDYASPEEKDLVSYDSKVEFDFNTFSLLKVVDVKLEENPYGFKNISYTFDGEDKLINLVINKNQKMSFNYNKTTLQFPSFQGYVEA